MGVEPHVFVQLEELAVGLPHVLHVLHPHQVFLQGHQLIVLLASIVRDTGHSVGQLHHVGVRSVIHQQHILELASQDSQIFDEDLVAHKGATFPIQAVLDHSIWVQMVDNRISVGLGTSCEDKYVKMLA